MYTVLIDIAVRLRGGSFGLFSCSAAPPRNQTHASTRRDTASGRTITDHGVANSMRSGFSGGTGLGNLSPEVVTDDSITAYEHSENELHQERHQGVELAAIIEAWPTLPRAVRAGIVAMVKAANESL